MQAVNDLTAIEKNTYDNHHFHVNQFTYKDEEDISKKEVSSISDVSISFIFIQLTRGKYCFIQ